MDATKTKTIPAIIPDWIKFALRGTCDETEDATMMPV